MARRRGRREHRGVTNQTSTPTPPPTQRPGSNRFFTWLRGLRVVRADGWIGGVCGGMALRTGLDPLIVRGIAVVIALLGGPALFFYAAAWLLLPDTHGEIHLERMLRGVFDAPLIAIAVLVVLTFTPPSQGVWWMSSHTLGDAWWVAAPATVLHVLWNLAIVAAIVWLVVWLVTRFRNTPRGQWPFADTAAPSTGASPDQAPGAAPQPGAPAAAAEQAGAQEADRTESAQEGPAAPGPGAAPGDLDDWRVRYDAWRQQHLAWQEQQRAQQRAAREVRGAEVRAQSQALAAELERQRLARRAANPRAAGWVVALVLGVALISGAVAGILAASADGASRYAGPIGAAVALIVIGLGMAVAGAARRRSGWLAFLAVVTIVVGTASFGLPVQGAPIGYTQLRPDRNATFSQFAGQVELDAARSDLGQGGTRDVRIDQTFGAVSIYLGDGVRARVRVTSSDSTVESSVWDGHEMQRQDRVHLDAPAGAPVERSWSNTNGRTAQLVVDVRQRHGGVYIYQGGGERPSSGYRPID
jgi:phage shock protein PspC (stress-responsive transcriptional regulator)